MKLLKKEFRLCVHPAAWMMLALGALILTPNYPYAVSFFYMTLGIFFICLSSRENHDAAYTLTLPVSRRDMVRGRVLLCCCLEGLDPVFLSLVDPSGVGEDVLVRLREHGVDTRFIRKVHEGMGTWLAVFDNNNDVCASISRRPELGPLLTVLQEKGNLSRKGLAAALGLTPAAMTKITAELLGEGLLLFSLFHIIFFPAWYKDIAKVGKPFVAASAAVFLYIVLALVSTYALPFVRDCLDTPDPAHLPEKLLFLLLSAGCYGLCTALSIRWSARNFEALDLQ